MDNLYYSVHPFKNEVQSSFSFNEKTIKNAIRRIYEKKFNPVSEIEEGIFNETWNIFNQATDEGFGFRTYTDPDFDFYQKLRYNNAVFAAFRTHRFQNDMAAQLLDKDGKLKPFDQFEKDVQPIADHNVHQWLRTEYDTAVIRAHQAADWEQFRQVKDILPNLRWMPTTSINPDLIHKQYWSIRLTLPQDHPFWNHHRPGDRWNCKCSLEATDDAVTTESNVPKEKDKPDKGLDNNPGKDARIFSDTHPYIEHSNKGAEKAVDKFLKQQAIYTIDGKKQIPVLNGKNMQINQIVADVEKDIRMNKGFETGIVIDKNGKILVDKRGKSFSVEFSEEECKLMKDSIMTHNHPRGWKYEENKMGRIGSSFSGEDLMLAVSRDVAEIRAVTPNYTFVMRRPEKGWGVSLDDFRAAYNMENKKLKDEFAKRISKGTLTIEQANATHFHVLSKRISKKYNWEYVKGRTR